MTIDGAVIHDDEHGKCGLCSPRHFLHQKALLVDSPFFFLVPVSTVTLPMLRRSGSSNFRALRRSARMVCPAGPLRKEGIKLSQCELGPRQQKLHKVHDAVSRGDSEAVGMEMGKWFEMLRHRDFGISDVAADELYNFSLMVTPIQEYGIAVPAGPVRPGDAGY